MVDTFFYQEKIRYLQNIYYAELILYFLTNMQDSYNRSAKFDRFIPNRSRKRLFVAKPQPEINFENNLQPYGRYLQKEILMDRMVDQSLESTILPNYCLSSVKNLLVRKPSQIEKKTQNRNINQSPEKILDAPQIKDDYYLNLLDWSSRGLLSIGLGGRVYFYSGTNATELCNNEDEYVCSVAFNNSGEQIVVGLSDGKVELYDVETETLIRTLKGHNNRVSSSCFTYGAIFTGSRDTKIIGHDYRAQQNIALKLQGHRGEVCGLKHDPCGLASGSNDNSAIIWDVNAGKMRYQLQGHKAAVKALAWCPWQRNLLATGGGTSDQTMKFWNIETGKLINSVNTDSQVCSLLWNKKDKQILSSHGFSENQLSLWSYPNCSKIVELHGHSQRVLHMAMAPDNNTICTASADETLRFWKVFDDNSPMGDDKMENKLSTKYCGLR